MPLRLTSESRHQRRFDRLTAVAVAATRRAWRRMDARARWEEQYAAQVGPYLTTVVAAAQVAATREADDYVAEVMTELALTPDGEPEPAPVLIAQSLAGFDGGGLPVESLLARTVADAGIRFNSLRSGTPEAVLSSYGGTALAQQALDDTEAVLEGYVQTILADTMRAAEEAAMAQRPWLTGYIRVAEPGACSRCLLLTGKFFLFNEGFLRHPRCRCNHVPAPDDRTAEGRRKRDALLSVESPERRFEALSEAERDRVFTKAGAQAIRDGADIGQVVNARRGMSKSQAGRIQRVEVMGRDVYVTTEGTYGRGRRKSRGPARPVRLMPESILEIADGDVAERIRLLRLYGYIV